MTTTTNPDQSQNGSFEDQNKRPANKQRSLNRPAMLIYKPPGLRGEDSPPSGASDRRQRPAAATKLSENNSENHNEENNNVRDSGSSRASSRASQADRDANARGAPRLNRTESSLSSESQLSQKSGGSSGQKPTTIAQNIPERKQKQPTPPRKEFGTKNKKVITEKDINEAKTGLRSLQMSTNAMELEQWITGDLLSEELAEVVGAALCQHAIEVGGGRVVAKLCGTLKHSQSSSGLIKGLVQSISQYFECRDRLRADHFRMWIAFLQFVADLYGNVGGGADGELVSFVFQVFEFLLRAPILENLKIEELESLISALLSVGYDLERECPDQLSQLKDVIRDAFIDVTEPWARKMILLLLELGASGWKLPPEANEYYFQQASS